MSTQFDYKDFVYQIQPQSMWCAIGSGAYSEAGARVEFWQEFQQYILPQLQKEYDNGWEAIGEVGPAGIKVQTTKEYFFQWGCMQWIIYVIAGLATYGIGLFLFPFMWATWVARPYEFRVALRKRR